MARYEVTLHIEQSARVVVEVDGPLPADRRERDRLMRDAALMKLDESGGAEREAGSGWEEYAAMD